MLSSIRIFLFSHKIFIMKIIRDNFSVLFSGLVLVIFLSNCSEPQKSVDTQEPEIVDTQEPEVVEDASEFPMGSIQIGVITSDLQKAIDFYTKVIGMTKTGGFSVDEAFAAKSGLSGGVPFDVTVLKLKDDPEAAEWKLMSFGKEATHPTQKYIQDDIGMQYVTIFVKSMKPFLERINEHNVDLLEETPTFLEDGRQFVLVQDPDGNFVELIGPAE
jgi:catechol 2,3-dioxygenase-like lactoylglutathione lyase family enzyme